MHSLNGSVPTPVSAAATPPVTVLICTRNRGAAPVAAARSVLASRYPQLSLLVIDQSEDRSTERALAMLGDDERLRYLHTCTQGLSIAQNVGLALSSSELVLMTDDDCEVAANWVEAMVAPFLEHPHVGLVFCDVVAGPHDPAAGFIPVSVATSSLLVTNLADWRTNGGVNIGIGAGMAVRRSVAVAVGGFNPDFGSGSRFRSGNDLEFCLQLLAAGAQVFRTTATNVIHHGFRTHAQSRQLLRNNLFGAGAVYGQLLRQGHWLGLRCWLVAFTMLVLRPALAYFARMQTPRVLGRAQSLLRGLVLGLLARPVLRTAGLRGVVPTTWTRAQPVRPEGRASLSL